jgi:hypothetical protein
MNRRMIRWSLLHARVRPLEMLAEATKLAIIGFGFWALIRILF